MLLAGLFRSEEIAPVASLSAHTQIIHIVQNSLPVAVEATNGSRFTALCVTFLKPAIVIKRSREEKVLASNFVFSLLSHANCPFIFFTFKEQISKQGSLPADWQYSLLSDGQLWV